MNYLQVSPKAKLNLIQPFLKNQQLTGIAAQKSVRTIDKRETGEYVPTCDSNCTYYPRWIPIGVNAPFIECNTVYTYGEGCADVYLCRDKTTPGKCTPQFSDPY
jgi:hypothetical protein